MRLWFYLAVIGITAAVLAAANWPTPRPEYHWHQQCIYPMNPETHEGYGQPANICDREFWDI